MDFKIGDDIDENGAVEHKTLSDRTKLIIIIVVALVAGLSVFFVTNALFGKKEVVVPPPAVTKNTLSMTDEDVYKNYAMLTYGVGKVRDKKFLSGIDIDINSFGNAEKYYFALQFAVRDDFNESDRTDEQGFKILTLPESSMDVYMQRFFGPDVSYSKEGDISNTFRFKVDGKDTGIIKYNSSNAEFEVSLSELRAVNNDNVVEGAYYYLDNAYSYSDGRLVLEEKVIYTKEVQNNDGSVDLYLYSDYDKTNSIGTINGVTNDPATASATEGEIVESADKYARLPKSFNMNDYRDKCGTITYNLKLDKYGYYFVNSQVSK